MNFRILSIDPGTNTLGYAILEVDEKGLVNILEAGTFNALKASMPLEGIREVHGDRTAKLYAISEFITKFLSKWCPLGVASESPFFGRLPQAFSALTECITYIRQGVMRHDPNMSIGLYDPPTVKKTMGVSGKSSDKELMSKALNKYNNRVKPTIHVDVSKLDEHAIDAICVGITHLIGLGMIEPLL